MTFGRYDYAAFTSFFAYASGSVVVPVALVQLARGLGFSLESGGMSAGGALHLGRTVPMMAAMLLCGFLACLVGLFLGLRVSGGVRVWGDPGPATTAAVLRAGGAGLGGLLLLGLGFGWLRLLLPGEDYRRRRRAVAARFPALALHLRPAPPGHGARGARIDLT